MRNAPYQGANARAGCRCAVARAGRTGRRGHRMMRRRQFALSVAAALALPFEVRAQQQAPRIGLLRLAPLDPTGHFLAVVGGGLKARGLRLLVVDASGGSDRLSAAARQLVAQKPDVVITFGDPSTKAMQQATTSIPIVAMTDDMVRSGLVASLAQPGGNTTGLSILTSELDVKRLQLLHEAVPQATRIGILEDRSTMQTRSRLEEAATRLGVELVIADFSSFDEVARAADRIAASGIGAVNVLATPLIGLSDIDRSTTPVRRPSTSGPNLRSAAGSSGTGPTSRRATGKSRESRRGFSGVPNLATCRSSSRQNRSHDQYEDREGAGPQGSASAARPRRRGHRVTLLRCPRARSLEGHYRPPFPQSTRHDRARRPRPVHRGGDPGPPRPPGPPPRRKKPEGQPPGGSYALMGRDSPSKRSHFVTRRVRPRRGPRRRP
jgi:hypothetical protein